MMKNALTTWACLLMVALLPVQADKGIPAPVDQVYATVDGQDLHVRLFLPEGVKNAPLVVYYHGGGWKAGSHRKTALGWLTQEGYAVASVQYRFSKVAKFPAQIHDCKAALRWLAAHAKEYGYDASKIAVAGHSAGGHLSMLLGTSQGIEELEGSVGEAQAKAPPIVAVIPLAGPSDFLLEATQWNGYAAGCIHGLLGGTAQEKAELAKAASPVTHVGEGDPPMLVVHGRKDKVVPFDQAERIVEAYQKAGLEVELLDIPEGGHGGKTFLTNDVRQRVLKFLNAYLKPAAVSAN